MTLLPTERDATFRADDVLWITGAGSGVGRAAAVAASRPGRTVVLSGRRSESLAETAELVVRAGGTAEIVPLDASDPAAITAAHAEIASRIGQVAGLVLSAGLNNPERYWRDQSLTDFEAILRTNLLGVAALIDAVLPGMRKLGGGPVVLISSYAGWRFSPDSGVAYSASKTALSAIAESLNAQENASGIRACNLCPGDIDSDFLAMRPTAVGADDRQSMLSPDDVARAVCFVLDCPPNICINELVITPTKKK